MIDMVNIIKTFTHYRDFVYSITTSILFSLSVEPFSQWYLAYIAFIPIIYRTYTADLKTIFKLYPITGAIISSCWGHSIIAYSWINFITLVCVVSISFLIWGLLNYSICRHYKGLLCPMLFSLAWIGIERIQTSVYIGVPGNIAITQSSQPELIQLASIFGIYSVSFLIILINSLLASSMYEYRYRRISSLAPSLGILLAVIIASLNYFYGSAKIKNDAAGDISIAIIQPSIASETYSNSRRNLEDKTYINNLLHTLSVEAINNDIDILFWPEGGNGHINMRLIENRKSLFAMAKIFSTDLLISSDDINTEGEKFNSIFLISKTGEYAGRYDKIHLIPGAEDSYTPGKSKDLLTTSHGKIGTAICYESVFSKPFRSSVNKGAEILFTSTSDAVFKQTSLALNHTNMSIFRAIENNRWLVHASNTGPSIVVSPTGEATTKTRMYDRGIVYANIERLQERSIYSRWGYLIPILISIIVSLIILVSLMAKLTFTIPKLTQLESIQPHYKKIASKVRDHAKKYLFYLSIYITISICLIGSSIYLVNIPITNTDSYTNIIKSLLFPASKHKDTLSAEYLQQHNNTCGPAALSYLLSFYGLDVNENEISKHINLTHKGASMLELKRAASIYGFQAKGYEGNFSWLLQQKLPLIAYINDNHYVVINKIVDDNLFLFDPGKGHIMTKRNSFEKVWRGHSLVIRTNPITQARQ